MPERAPAKHTLRAGESIRSVAYLHGTTPLKLMELNPYTDPSALKVGQALNLPPSHAPLWPFLARLLWRTPRAEQPP